jgi:hypothetical protein
MIPLAIFFLILRVIESMCNFIIDLSKKSRKAFSKPIRSYIDFGSRVVKKIDKRIDEELEKERQKSLKDAIKRRRGNAQVIRENMHE